MRRSLLAATGLLWLAYCPVQGCAFTGASTVKQLQAEDPAARIGAAVRAGQTGDRSAVPYLVDRLTDAESDVRFFAAIALERITGQTMGWRHYDPPDRRAEAVKRWRQWLAERASGAGEGASVQAGSAEARDRP